MSINFYDHSITTSGTITSPSGNFTTLVVNGTSVSNFNSSVSGLLPTIANSGDNRVLTSTGSSVGINAEANLTFDGTLLNVSGSGTFASGVNISNQTGSTIASFDANKNVISLTTSTYPSLTELSYVKGVTSAIQTQIGTKANSSITMTAGSGIAGGGDLSANRSFDIGQGDGITVNADSIAVDSTVIRTTGTQTITGNKTISVSTGVGLTITNTGTSDSFVVNDESSDTTPFIIDAVGNVGIGSTSPTTLLHILGTGEGIHSGRVGGGRPHLRLQHANGTIASRTISASGNYVGQVSFEGYNGTSYMEHTGIFGIVNGTVTTSSIPTDLVFSAGSSGNTASNERMRITSAGNVGIGLTPSFKLDVYNGNIRSGYANNSALLVTANSTASTGAAIAIQQTTGEGWTAIFADFEPYAEWGFYHDNPNNRFDFTAGDSTNSLRSYSITNRTGNTATAYAKVSILQSSGDLLVGGSVGIGTSSPATRLHVAGTSSTFNGLLLTTTASGAGSYTSIHAGTYYPTWTVAPPASIRFIDDGNFSSHIAFRTKTSGSASNSDVERFRITSAGNTEIRANAGNVSSAFVYNENGGELVHYDETQTAATLLDQSANQTRLLELINGSNLVLGLGGSNTTGSIVFVRAGYNEAMRIDSTGAAWMKTTRAWNDAVPTLSIGNDADGRLQTRHIWGKASASAAAEHLWLQHGNTNNHVQIGATGGANNLYVVGDIYANGYFGGALLLYGASGMRRGVHQITNWNQTTLPDVAFLSSENSVTNAPTTDFSYGIQYAFHRSGAAFRTQLVTSLYSDLDIWVRNSRDSDVWTAWKKLLHSSNYNSYSPTLTGGGASGTWGINVTGTAAGETLGTVTGRGTTTNSIVQSNASVRAPIFYDSNDTNFYCDPNGTSRFAALIITGSDLYVGDGVTSSIIRMRDSDEGERQLHCNSNRIGFLNQSGGWGSWCEDDGSWATDFAVYAPIFYDRNNTAYYLDPASTSVLNRVNPVGWDTSGRNYSREWIEFTNHSGLYSTLNAAHFYPNNGSYGSWRIAGTRNGWAGLEFDSTGAGNVSLMMNSGHTGVHNNTYGWQWYWTGGKFYVSTATNGGGTMYPVVTSKIIGAALFGFDSGTFYLDTYTGAVTSVNRVSQGVYQISYAAGTTAYFNVATSTILHSTYAFTTARVTTYSAAHTVADARYITLLMFDLV